MVEEEDNNGWIESIDPTTGRKFYANRYTRTTQWDPPPGWSKKAEKKSSASILNVNHNNGHNINILNNGTASSGANDNNVLSDIARVTQQQRSINSMEEKKEYHEELLPDGWEEMIDATTGRKFYIDHATKTTTWERPTRSTATNHDNDNDGSSMMMPIMKLNQNGSHSTWSNPHHSGSSRASTSHSSNHNHHNGGYNYKRQDSYSMMMNDNSSSHKGPPPLDFTVISIPDSLRNVCPGCYSAFTYTKRRHHCRLCGVSFTY